MPKKLELNGQILDKEQRRAVLEKKNLLLVAGAGSGKTFTIIAKIKYLIEKKHIDPKKIICFSFTKEAVMNMEKRLAKENIKDVEVKTFHKFALDLYKIRPNLESNLLPYIIDEYFICIIKQEPWYQKILSYYMKEEIFNYEVWYLKNSIKIDCLKKEIIKLIHLIKANYEHFSFKDLYQKIKRTSKSSQKKSILLFVFLYHLYNIYQEELKSTGSKDFDDLIIDGIKNISSKLNYQYIFIDEYQDISYIREKLILSLKEVTNAQIFAVGDDYQAIYRFAGSDISLFKEFKKHIKKSKIRKLQTTYRSNYELITIAGKFIQKNSNQWQKTLRSNTHYQNPIKIIKTINEKQTVQKIINSYPNNKTIFILGRTNKEQKVFDELKKGQNCKFYTVHRAKGLEADVVILLNLTNQINGFPSLMEESDLTKLIMQKKEDYPYAEERRLFYVAITRAKERVYLITSMKNQSIFIKEIEKMIKHPNLFYFSKICDIIQAKKG